MASKRKRSIAIAIIVPVVLLAAAYLSKPTDKKCIIAAVEGIWGYRTPDKDKLPIYYEQFMELNSKQVAIDDWIFLKRIRYRFKGGYQVVGYGAFSFVYLLVRNR